MVNIDLLYAHPIQGFLGIVSAGSCFLGAFVEILRAQQEISALYAIGSLVTIRGLTSGPDCSGMLPGTDIPFQVGFFCSLYPFSETALGSLAQSGTLPFTISLSLSA
jgi:hypothetical protein